MTTKKLVLIPYWVEDALRRNGQPLADCLNLGKIRKIIPMSDLVAFVALQNYWKVFIGVNEPMLDSLVMQWFSQVGPAGAANNDELSHHILPLSNDPSVARDLEARLFDPAARCGQYKEPFNSYDLTPEFAGAVIYPGFFGLNDKPSVDAFVRAMLKVLYVYESHSEVAKSPLFRRYLALLPV